MRLPLFVVVALSACVAHSSDTGSSGEVCLPSFTTISPTNQIATTGGSNVACTGSDGTNYQDCYEGFTLEFSDNTYMTCANPQGSGANRYHSFTLEGGTIIPELLPTTYTLSMTGGLTNCAVGAGVSESLALAGCTGLPSVFYECQSASVTIESVGATITGTYQITATTPETDYQTLMLSGSVSSTTCN